MGGFVKEHLPLPDLNLTHSWLIKENSIKGHLYEILVDHTGHGFHMVFKAGLHFLDSIEEFDVYSPSYVFDRLPCNNL